MRETRSANTGSGASDATLPFRGGNIGIYRCGDAAPDAPLICLLVGQENGAAIRTRAFEAGARPFRMAEIPVADWNGDLSPWCAPQPFGNGAAFTGGADAFLREMEAVLPALRSALCAPDAPCFLAGYSLAGLFAVYALYRSEIFSGAVSVSGSLWFPGFTDFTASHTLKRVPERVYFSLGDRESRTKNLLFCRTEDDTRALCGALRAMGTDSLFESNPGGHFQDPEKRMARGISWVTN